MIPLDPNYGSKKRYYFAYGSNTDEQTLLRRLQNAHVKGSCLSSPSLDLTKIGNASLHGYTLGFAGNSEFWNGPVATITRDPTKAVKGVLYLTDKSQEDTLSCFENADAHHPDGFYTYRKYKVLVDCDDGNTYDAYTFVLSPLMGPAKEQPKQKYLDVLDSGQEQMKTEELVHKHIRESARAANGDCYEAAGKFMMDTCRGDCNLILVHGEVGGQGPLEGVTFGHAWVLDGNTVIDKSNGRDVQMPRPIYYAVGQIDNIGNFHQYTWPEARKQILDSGHWGPWELVTESGL